MKKPIYTQNINGFPIKLYEFKNRSKYRFSVQYGQQVDNELNYNEAAEKLGEAILHALACESLISNE